MRAILFNLFFLVGTVFLLEDSDEGIDKYDHAYFEAMEAKRHLLKEGDIISEKPDPQFRSSAMRKHSLKWPNAKVAVKYSDSFNRTEKSLLTYAMREIEEKTCVRFRFKTPDDGDVIMFGKPTDEVKCSSMVENRNFSLVKNVWTEGRFFMKLCTLWVLFMNTDKSIDTIIPKKRNVQLGGGNGLSDIDVERINLYYDCPERTTHVQTTDPPIDIQPATPGPTTTTKPPATAAPPELEWKTENGVTWSNGCFFTTVDVHETTTKEQCGPYCKDYTNCDHFSWISTVGNIGQCHLMANYRATFHPKLTSRNSACGNVPGKVNTVTAKPPTRELVTTPEPPKKLTTHPPPPSYLWPNGKVAMKFSPSFTASEKRLITEALKEIQSKTCVRFHFKKPDDADFVVFARPSDNAQCGSQVGRKGGNQPIYLGAICLERKTILHEVMHILGFDHEHTRSDRDEYVTINWDNIPLHFQDNFKKRDPDEWEMLTGYAYNSIMHFRANQAAMNRGIPTIVAKNASAKLGGGDELSEIDVKRINMMYKCPGQK